jgi:hypothetical protein
LTGGSAGSRRADPKRPLALLCLVFGQQDCDLAVGVRRVRVVRVLNEFVEEAVFVLALHLAQQGREA